MYMIEFKHSTRQMFKTDKRPCLQNTYFNLIWKKVKVLRSLKTIQNKNVKRATTPHRLLVIEFPNLVLQSSSDTFSFALVSQLPCSAFFQLELSCFSSAAAACVILSIEHISFLYPHHLISVQSRLWKLSFFMVISFLMLHQIAAIFKRTFHAEMKNKSCCQKICSDARGVYISYK